MRPNLNVELFSHQGSTLLDGVTRRSPQPSLKAPRGRSTFRFCARDHHDGSIALFDSVTATAARNFLTPDTGWARHEAESRHLACAGHAALNADAPCGRAAPRPTWHWPARTPLHLRLDARQAGRLLRLRRLLGCEALSRFTGANAIFYSRGHQSTLSRRRFASSALIALCQLIYGGVEEAWRRIVLVKAESRISRIPRLCEQRLPDTHPSALGVAPTRA